MSWHPNPYCRDSWQSQNSSEASAQFAFTPSIPSRTATIYHYAVKEQPKNFELLSSIADPQEEPQLNVS